MGSNDYVVFPNACCVGFWSWFCGDVMCVSHISWKSKLVVLPFNICSLLCCVIPLLTHGFVPVFLLQLVGLRYVILAIHVSKVCVLLIKGNTHQVINPLYTENPLRGTLRNSDHPMKSCKMRHFFRACTVN